LKPRILEVRTKVLKKNDELARQMRSDFSAADLLTINLVSSPGTGKTTLLESTLGRLKKAGGRCLAIVGDLATDNDARRLARSGVPVRQIETGGCCHLEAEMIRDHLADWKLPDYDFLFIENVGNLVCPTSWDLGEALRVVLLSVTEGEDKPLKYPGLFNTADVTVITKIDLADPCEFDRQAAYDNIHAVRPSMPILETSAKTGTGMESWIEYLQQQREQLTNSQ